MVYLLQKMGTFFLHPLLGQIGVFLEESPPNKKTLPLGKASHWSISRPPILLLALAFFNY